MTDQQGKTNNKETADCLKTELDKILKIAEKIQFSKSQLGRAKRAYFIVGVHFVIDKLLKKEQR